LIASVVFSYVSTADLDAIRPEVRRQLAHLLGANCDRPLAGLLKPGQMVVIKPNMVRHFNPAGPLAAVITEPAIIRVLAELAYDEVGPDGRIIVADSPQNDCDLQALLATPGWVALLEWANATLGDAFEVLDMRPEKVTMRDGVVVHRRPLAGDPRGEVLIDLAEASAFVGSGIDPTRLRGSEYDPALTLSSHADGRHSYSICRTFLDADLLIVVPKVKTHKKVGLSLAMKNLVGVVGEKNRLPHHTAGFAGRGGDEYPSRSLRTVTRQWGVERSRHLLARGHGVGLLRSLRKVEKIILPEFVARSGNWSGNDTAWRMVIDLVTILRRKREDAGRPTLFVYDGLVVGEGDGPLAPYSLEYGMLASSLDPVAGDRAVATELGVDPDSMPLLREATARSIWSSESASALSKTIVGINPGIPVRMHPGWPVTRPSRRA
jgi:uncharacterized protein (DUF362 family)